MVLLVGSRYLCLVEIMLLARCEGGCCGGCLCVELYVPLTQRTARYLIKRGMRTRGFESPEVYNSP